MSKWKEPLVLAILIVADITAQVHFKADWSGSILGVVAGMLIFMLADSITGIIMDRHIGPREVISREENITGQWDSKHSRWINLKGNDIIT
jgi:hypothetical protein